MLVAHRVVVYRRRMNRANVKVNLELGRALRAQLEADAESACRKLSWQVLYLVNLSLDHGPFIHHPNETLDDNDGRFTAYIPEPIYDKLQLLADSYSSNLSAIVRASILHGMALEKARDT